MTKFSGGEKDFIQYADQVKFKNENDMFDNAIITVIEKGFVKASQISESGSCCSRIFGPGESINSLHNLALFRLSEEVGLKTIDKTKRENAFISLQLQINFLYKSQTQVANKLLTNRMSVSMLSRVLGCLFLDYGVVKKDVISLPFKLTDEVLGELIPLARENVSRLRELLITKTNICQGEKNIYYISKERLDNLVKDLDLSKI